MAEHPNIEAVQRFLDAYAANDEEGMAAFLADDIVWHVGGDHPHSGDYQGRDEVLGYFAEMKTVTSGTLTLEPIEILASDRHAAILMAVVGTRGDRRIDATLFEAFTIHDGRCVEFWSLADDQDQIDEFWR
jgi:uncharacterized protein